jgi:hypothetical protein
MTPAQTLARALTAPTSYPTPPRVRSTGAPRSKRRWLAQRLVRATYERRKRTPFTPEWLALPALCRVGVSIGFGIAQGIRSGIQSVPWNAPTTPCLSQDWPDLRDYVLPE